MTSSNSDAAQMTERLEFMAIDERQRAALREMKPIVNAAIGPALALFYEKIAKVSETSHFFADRRHMAHAQEKQQQHWDVITSAEFTADYQRRVRTVGTVHARLGLEPRWYIGGYALVAEQLIHAVVKQMWPRLMSLSTTKPDGMATAISALMKATFLDMELAISIYLEALEEKRREAELVRDAADREQQLAITAMTKALDRLAQGDLTAEITEQLTPQFDGLKTNFNTSIQQLRDTMVRVVASANAIDANTREIANASDDLSRRTEQQAANLEQTAAALDEITATVNKAAEGANHAREVVVAATSNAQSSGNVVRKAVEAMTGIEKSSQQISQIIGVIDEIAFQTNLLALNAGVEAARAGEAGRGFAVVASEVRALAQRSAEAAKEIKALIQTSSTQVDAGVELVAETGTSLERIIKQVSEINDVVSDIAAGAREQAIGLQEVNNAINQMDQVTQQNAAMVEQSTASSHALTQETSDLMGQIQKFRLPQPGHRDRAASDRQERQRRRPTSGPVSATPARKQGRTAPAARTAPSADTPPESWEDF